MELAVVGCEECIPTWRLGGKSFYGNTSLISRKGCRENV